MQPTACIKRPSSLWTQCRCPNCIPEQARLNKMRRNGRYRRPTSDQAWEIIDRLRARGWTSLAVATATGIPHPTMQNAFTLADRGTRQEFGPGVSLRILRHGQPTAGSVGAYAARRRLQGLTRQGWSLESLAAETGLPFSTVAAIRTKVSRIKVAHDQAIREATDRIGMTIGTSPAAARHAEKVGWPSLLAWDDIDDPDEKPAATTEPAGRKQYLDHAAIERRLNGDRGVRLTRGEACEVVRRLYRRGIGPKFIEDHLGLKAERYLKWSEFQAEIAAASGGEAVA